MDVGPQIGHSMHEFTIKTRTNVLDVVNPPVTTRISSGCALRLKEHSHIAQTQKHIPRVLSEIHSHPSFWLGGILPASLFLEIPIPIPCIDTQVFVYDPHALTNGEFWLLAFRSFRRRVQKLSRNSKVSMRYQCSHRRARKI